MRRRERMRAQKNAGVTNYCKTALALLPVLFAFGLRATLPQFSRLPQALRVRTPCLFPLVRLWLLCRCRVVNISTTMMLATLNSSLYTYVIHGNKTAFMNTHKKRKPHNQGNYPFVVVEGVTGAGKTTLSRALETYLSGMYIASTPECLASIRHILGKDRTVNERFGYYLLGNFFCSRYAQYIVSLRPVICDRYVHSTIATHTLQGSKTTIKLPDCNFLQPDLSIFLLISDERERRRRITMRNKKNPCDTVFEDSDYREKYINYFRSVGGYTYIETAGCTIDEVRDVAMNIIRTRFPWLASNQQQSAHNRSHGKVSPKLMTTILQPLRKLSRS